jgi:hypothetical protein
MAFSSNSVEISLASNLISTKSQRNLNGMKNSVEISLRFRKFSSFRLTNFASEGLPSPKIMRPQSRNYQAFQKTADVMSRLRSCQPGFVFSFLHVIFMIDSLVLTVMVIKASNLQSEEASGEISLT